MPEAVQATVITQMGEESVVKTSVAANKQVSVMQVSSWKAETQNVNFPGMGLQHPQGVANNKNWGSFKWGGPIDFNEIYLGLDAALGSATKTTPTNGVLTRKRVWTLPNAFTVRSQKTKTVEHGSSVKAEKMTGCFMHGFDFKLARENPTFDSDWLGSSETRSITFTSTPTLLGTNTSHSVGAGLRHYKDTSAGGIGGTAYAGKVFDAGFSVSGLASVSWPEDNTLTTWDAIIDLVPSLSMMMTVESDATGESLIDDAVSCATHYLRQEIKGNLIEAVTPNYYYSLTIDVAAQIMDIGERKVSDGVRVYDVTWVPVYDATLPPTLTLYNTIA